MLDFFSQAMYALEMLRGRSGVIRCLPRFDIAPGSNVLIENNPAFPGDNLGLPLMGTVLQVSGQIEAESPSSSVTMRVGYLRTLKENESDDTSIDSHPLYDQAFVGAPLLDEFA